MSKYSLQKKKVEYKYTEPVAIDQLMILLDHYDIDIDKIEDKSQKKSTESTFDQIILAIRDELIEIKKGQDGIPEVTQRFTNGNTVKWEKLSGKHKVQTGNLIETQGYPAIYKLAGSMTNLGEIAIQNLSGKDLKTVEALALIFLLA